MTYAKLAEMLRPFGFEQKPTEGEHCLLQHEKEKDWVIVFPGGKRFQKRVEIPDLMSLRAHFDHWGLLHTKTIEELVEKLQK